MKNLAGYKVPREVGFLDEPPRNSTCKVLEGSWPGVGVGGGAAGEGVTPAAGSGRRRRAARALPGRPRHGRGVRG
jgi:hypothetical protein